jgi:hypothetical protein
VSDYSVISTMGKDIERLPRQEHCSGSGRQLNRAGIELLLLKETQGSGGRRPRSPFEPYTISHEWRAARAKDVESDCPDTASDSTLRPDYLDAD